MTPKAPTIPTPDDLKRATKQVMLAEERLERARVARDDLILRAANAGWSTTSIASLTGMTVGRISQIKKEANRGA